MLASVMQSSGAEQWLIRELFANDWSLDGCDDDVKDAAGENVLDMLLVDCCMMSHRAGV